MLDKRKHHWKSMHKLLELQTIKLLITTYLNRHREIDEFLIQVIFLLKKGKTNIIPNPDPDPKPCH